MATEPRQCPDAAAVGSSRSDDERFMTVALAEARSGMSEGGVPIGACLVDGASGRVLGVGRNRRVQEGSVVKHGEIDCLEKCGQLSDEVYRRSTLYTTLSPCDMCTGAVLFFHIPRVVFGEDRTDYGGQDYLRQRGVEVVNLDSSECYELMQEFIKQKPHIWMEDNAFKFQG